MNDIKVVKNPNEGTVSIVKIGRIPGKWGWDNLAVPGYSEVDLSAKYSKADTSKCENLETAVKMGLLQVVKTYSSKAATTPEPEKVTPPPAVEQKLPDEKVIVTLGTQEDPVTKTQVEAKVEELKAHKTNLPGNPDKAITPESIAAAKAADKAPKEKAAKASKASKAAKTK